MILPKVEPILIDEGCGLTQRFRSTTPGIHDRENIRMGFRMEPTTNRTNVLSHALTPSGQAMTLELFGVANNVMMELVQLSDHVKDARIGHVELVQKSTVDR